MCITMAASIASQFPNLDKNDAAYAAFIKEKIDKAGGQIKFQHITGHLSQLDLSVRQVVGASPSDLRQFLKKHNGLFTVDSEGFVSFQKPLVPTTEKTKKNPRRDDTNTIESESLFPVSLKEVPGIVIKVLPNYGFIAIKNPIKTSIYFTPACVVDDKFYMQDEKGRFLTDIADMLPGKKVLLNAKKANTDFHAKYRATRVWTPKDVKNEVLVPDGFKPKVPKEGIYDPVSIEGSGKVQKVFEQFGFITNDNSSENVFFHKSRVCNVDNIMNLAKVFSPGDSVEFKAIRSTKKDIKVRWEASKVWIKKQGKTNLLFKADSSGFSECDSQSQKGSQKRNAHVMLKAECGKIFPHTDGVVIKFGKNDTQLADADSCPFYLHGSKVQDVCWEFCDGDNVQFDGIKIKSAPGWKALLAWVGERPNIVLPADIGDFTEFSDDDNVSVNENIIPDKKPRGVQSSEYSRKAKKNLHSKSCDRSKIFRPSSVLSEDSIASSRSVSQSRSSVDKDFELLSEDTMSSISGESKPQTSAHHKRRHRNRRQRYNPTKPVYRVSSFSSLTDNDTVESEGSSYTNTETIEFHNSDIHRDEVVPNILPQATLKPSLSIESLDLETCLQPNPDLFKNWGDTPYPEEDCKKLCSATEEKTSLAMDNVNQFEKVDRNSPLLNRTVEKASSLTNSYESETFQSDDEFNDTVQGNESIDTEVTLQKHVQDDNESPKMTRKDVNTLPDLVDIFNRSDSDSETSKVLKADPYVKCFYDLEGKILKVFCKYAEIEHSALKKSVSVLWNDLYHNGVPVSDKFDDMKEVIKSGQTIKFSCIEIIDDEGAFWQKVTIAWKGQKPNIKEMTAQEYISQNYLHVSVNENDIDYGTHGNSSRNMGPLNIAPEPAVVAPPRKFLAVADSDVDEEDEPSIETDSSPSTQKEQLDASHLNVEQTLPERMQVVSIEPVEEDDLEEAVRQMISSYVEPQVDVRALSSNIINLVRSKTIAPKSVELPSTSGTYSDTMVQYSKNQINSTDSIQTKSRNDIKDSETQTIITGDVIAQSIFTL